MNLSHELHLVNTQSFHSSLWIEEQTNVPCRSRSFFIWAGKLDRKIVQQNEGSNYMEFARSHSLESSQYALVTDAL